MSEYKWDKFNDYLYRVKIPRIFTRTVEDIKMRGNRISGIKRYDDMINKELMEIEVCINRLVRYFEDSVPIIIVNKEDADKIYDVIQEKLEESKNQLTYSINGPTEGVDRLMTLDRFANAIYNNNFRFVFKENVIDKGLFGDKPNELNYFFDQIDNAGSLKGFAMNNTPAVVDNGDRQNYAETFDNNLRRFRKATRYG